MFFWVANRGPRLRPCLISAKRKHSLLLPLLVIPACAGMTAETERDEQKLGG